AVTQYSAYVKDQVEALKTDTDEFAKLYQEGKNDEAKAKYAAARIHYERIEPIAEKSYGKTLDLKLDARETDLEEGNVQEWTGWHKIEKDLWQPKADANDGKEYKPLTTEERKQISEKLVKDTQELYDYVHSDEFKLDAFQISNGAKELLDEVVNTKLTGEEENWSHTDLSDFQGNVDGAKVDYENLLPILQKKNPELAKTLQEKFDAVQKILDKYKQDDGFKPYNELSKEEVRELSDAVTALAEPVSQMTETVAGGESAEGKSGDTSSSKPAASSESSAGASQDASEPAAGTSSATAK
ncbi:MAG: iron uptake system protein EfeO, partial [Rothia dentocariosa]